MDKIHEVVVDHLSLGELSKILPVDYQHLCVNNAKAGSQPSKTFIVGVLQDAFKKFLKDSIPKKRLTLREVLADGKEGDRLDVFTYSEYANAIDDFLKSSKNGQNLWIVFSSIKFVAYQGYEQDGWCTFSLRVGQKHSCEAQMWLVIQARPVTPAAALVREKKISKQTELVSASEVVSMSRKHIKTINDCIPSKKATVFAVVNQIVKPPQMTHKGTHHMLLALVDPSCLVPGAQREDLLLHIFLNDTSKPHLPDGVERGDILLLKEMTIERFADKVHGKVYNNKQVVKFSSDITAPVKPITEKNDFVLTDTDRKEVITLRHWWEEVSSLLQVPQEPPVPGSSHGTEHRGSHLSEHTISEINEEMTFSLFCQVMETRLVQALNQKMLIYRVRDGTQTAVYFSQYDLHEATHELLTQTESCITVGALLVDIIVMSPGEEALNILDKSFVCLNNVHCLENNVLSAGDFPNRVFDLSVKSNINNIIRLPASHIEAQKIIRRLTGNKDTKDSNDSIVGLGREPTTIEHAVNPLRPSQKPSPNRIDSQPLSPQRIYHPRSGACPSVRRHISISRSYPAGEWPSQQRSILSSPRIPSHSDSMEHLMRELQSPLEASRNINTADKTQNPANTSNSHCPPGRNQANGNADAGSKVMLLSDLPSNAQRSTLDINAKVFSWLKNKDGETTEGPAASIHSENTEVYAGTIENISFPSLSPVSQVQQDMNQQNENNQCQQSNKSYKRKLPMNIDCVVSHLGTTSKKIKSVLNGDFTDSTLKKVFEECNTEVVYRVSAVVKELYFLSSSPCEKCTNDQVCIHNWVWGLCDSCGECYTDWKLRECFSHSNLKSSLVLPCIACSSSSFKGFSSDQPSVSTYHAAEDRTRVAHVSGTITPVIRLKVLLSDPQSGFESMVNLSGDHAKKFIGLEPKFSWLVEETEENLANLVKIVLDLEMPLLFGIQKLETSLGIAQFDICNTTLKCTDEQLKTKY